MAKPATASNNWQSKVNRTWGLTVLKTAYRDTYPKVTAETISENAQTVEEKMFEKAISKKGYDESVSRAVDAIITLGRSVMDLEHSNHWDSLTSHAGRTPRSTTRNIVPNRRVASGVKPMYDPVRMVNMSTGRKSHAPFLNASRNQTPSSIGSKLTIEKTPVLGKIDFYHTRLDESDVIKLVPFVLEAGVLVNGKMETADQAKCISESQKSSIGLLAIQKMSRALEIAAKNDSTASAASKSNIQSLSGYDQEKVRRRAKDLQMEYMQGIRSIYAKLGEKFDTPDCDETMILNISNSLKKLEELEDDSYQVSKQSIHALDYVENVFKIAIEQYGTVVKGGDVPSSRFKAPKGGGWENKAGKSFGWRPTSSSYCTAGFGSEAWNDDDGGEFNYGQNLDCNEKSADQNFHVLNHARVIAKYRGIINGLFPLVEANLGKYSDAAQIWEEMGYIRAFLTSEDVRDVEVLRSGEKTIDRFYQRFSHLVREEIDRAGQEEGSGGANGWAGALLENIEETDDGGVSVIGERVVNVKFSEDGVNEDDGESEVGQSDEQTTDGKNDETEVVVDVDYERIFGPPLPEECSTRSDQDEEDCANGEEEEEEEEEEKEEEVVVKQGPEVVKAKKEPIEKAEQQETSIEEFTPRRSKRSAVIKARINRRESTRGSTTSARSTNGAGAISGHAGQR